MTQDTLPAYLPVHQCELWLLLDQAMSPASKPLPTLASPLQCPFFFSLSPNSSLPSGFNPRLTYTVNFLKGVQANLGRFTFLSHILPH